MEQNITITVSQAKTIIESIRHIATLLTVEEAGKISRVIYSAVSRMEREEQEDDS